MPTDPTTTLELDLVTSAVLLTVARVGCIVSISEVGDRFVATGTGAAGETWIVRAADPYTAAVELAKGMGVDLRVG